MLSYLLLALLFGASAHGMPKTRDQVKDELNAIATSSLLMPGPVLLPGKSNQLPLDSKNNRYCTLCQLVVSEVDSMLKKQSTEEEIKDKLYMLCSEAPLISAQCKKFVDDYLDPIIQALDRMSPQMVCKELGVCDKRGQIPVVNAVNEVKAIKTTPQCELCQMIVKEVDEALFSKSTKQQIEQALEQACKTMKPAYRDKCEAYVKKHLSAILDMLAHELSPDVICGALHLCESPKIKQVVNTVNEVKAIKMSPQCALCRMIVKKVDEALFSNSSKQQIEQALEQACKTMKPAYRDKCEAYVKEHLSAILDMLAHELSPDVICSALHLCESPKIKQDNMVKITPCDLCMSVMNVAKKLVEDNDTEADVVKALQLICFYMLPVYHQCVNFINRTVPLVFNELKKLDPKTICEQLKLCPWGFLPKDARCYMKERNICDNHRMAKKCRIEPYCEMIEGFDDRRGNLPTKL